jgi:hypothetical protein
MATNKITFPLQCPASVAAGQAVDCKGFSSTGRFQLSGTFVGTVQLEESTDGVTYTVVGVALTAPGVVSANPSAFAQFLRANVTAYTSGAMVMSGVANLHG